MNDIYVFQQYAGRLMIGIKVDGDICIISRFS